MRRELNSGLACPASAEGEPPWPPEKHRARGEASFPCAGQSSFATILSSVVLSAPASGKEHEDCILKSRRRLGNEIDAIDSGRRSLLNDAGVCPGASPVAEPGTAK